MESVAHIYINIIQGTLLILCNINISDGGISGISSVFKLFQSANKLNPEIVNQTYQETKSVLHCGLMCAYAEAVTFYFLEETSTCHCNNRYDTEMKAKSASGNVTYGYPFSRPGNSSECQTLYDNGHRLSGVFNTSSGKLIKCNLTDLGWVVFQRRIDGSVDFERNWADYEKGFGNKDGEFWLGLERLYNMTKTLGCELHIYLEALEAEPNNTIQYQGYARFNIFSVDNPSTNYTLRVGDFSGNVGDSLTTHTNSPFSTPEADHDGLLDINCAGQYGGGWWYDVCLQSALNSRHPYIAHAEESNCITWYKPWKFSCSLVRVEMALRC